MTWFRVDDSAHTHPKLRRAGTAAIGLWTLGGAYSAHYLTDGAVHAHFIKTNATGPQVAKLVKAGLWHTAGHVCKRCPQPAEGDYQMHDYLDYNMSRAQVEKARAKAAEKKRKQRSAEDYDSNPGGFEEDSDSNRDGNHLDSSRKSTPDIRSTAGQSDVSPGDSNGPRARASQPSSALPLPPLEEEEQASRAGEAGDVPAVLQPLADALHHAGLVGLGWDLKGDEGFRIQALMKAKGIPALVGRALSSAARAPSRVGHVTYFLGRNGHRGPWLDLPTVSAPPPPSTDLAPRSPGDVVVQFPPPGSRPSTTDRRVQDVYDVTAELKRELGMT